MGVIAPYSDAIPDAIPSVSSRCVRLAFNRLVD